MCVDRACWRHARADRGVESARRARRDFAARLGERVGRADEPSVPAAAIRSRVGAPCDGAASWRVGPRYERRRRDGRRDDRRHQRRAGPPSKNGSVVLRGKLSRHSRTPCPDRRGWIPRGRRDHAVRRALVAGAAAPTLVAKRRPRARGDRPVAVRARNFQRRCVAVCARSQLGLRGGGRRGSGDRQSREACRTAGRRAAEVAALSEAGTGIANCLRCCCAAICPTSGR